MDKLLGLACYSIVECVLKKERKVHVFFTCNSKADKISLVYSITRIKQKDEKSRTKEKLMSN